MKPTLIVLAIAWGIFGIILALASGIHLNKQLHTKREGSVLIAPSTKQFDIGSSPKQLAQDELDRRANNEVLALRNHEIPHTLRKYNPDGTVEEWNPVDGCWRFIRNWNPETGSAFRR